MDGRQRVEGAALLRSDFYKTEVTELARRCSSDAVIGTKNWEIEVIVSQAVLSTPDAVDAQIRKTWVTRMNLEDKRWQPRRLDVVVPIGLAVL